MKGLFDLSGHVAVVTGALGRLGPVWMEGLLQAGARVVGIDLPGAILREPVAELERRYGCDHVRIYRADALDGGALIAARDRCESELGRATILVNNAGIDQPPTDIGRTYRLEEFPLEQSRAVLEVNVLGVLQVSQVFGREMARIGRGSIINIGSIYASVAPDPRLYEHLLCDPPFIKPPAYGASKAAVVSLTKYMAAHWGPYGVRVNALSPGGVAAQQDAEFRRKFCERVPLRRMAEERDLVGPLVFLASDASAYVSGVELRVDGGFTAW